MNVNKKLDRLKQWGKERMGGEVKTDTSDDFKALEVEMQLRQDGMDKLKKSADVYIKSLSKRDRYDDKDQQLPVGYFGTAMVNHGDDFEVDSEFGQCLSMLGRANERIARVQETYGANATSSWLESLERSLLQLKEYQAARKKLESRRLAYDTASVKMQKSKKEDYRMEEELRSQKMKYEESSEDVYRRMLDIKDAEIDSVADLTSFLDAELTYHDRCREVLMQLKRDWPASLSQPPTRSSTASPFGRRPTIGRSRASSTATDKSGTDQYYTTAPAPLPRSRLPSGANSPFRELPGFDLPVGNSSGGGGGGLAAVRPKPFRSISATSASSTSAHVSSSAAFEPLSRTQSQVSDSSSSSSTTEGGGRGAGHGGGRRAPPPPPPPSRAKKPPPPPPPLRRSATSGAEVSRY